MPYLRLLPISLVLATCFGVPSAAQADLTQPETLLLDSFSATTSGFSGPVSTSEPLTAGVVYAAEVRGTFSRYVPRLMAGSSADHLLCGAPEAEPQTPSPGRPVSRVGVDAEFLFARVNQTQCTAGKPAGFFQANTGSGFAHPTANGAPFSAAAAGHAYTYLLQGQGAPASFRITDSETRDNNGVLTIIVRPASAVDTAGVTPSQTAAAATGTTAGAGDLIAGPTRKSCVSRRKFRIRIRSTKADPIRSATVRVNGKTVQVVSAKVNGRVRRVSTIDLRGLPAGRARVEITARLRSGTIRKGVRRYFTCKPKLSGSIPKL